MYKEIKVGEINVPMLATAATPLRYKLIFGKDLITELQGAESNSAKVLDALPELAFIMAKTAEARDGKADLNRLNQESYLEWLDQFSPMDLPLAAEEILNLYVGNALTTSEPKKNRSGKAKES